MQSKTKSAHYHGTIRNTYSDRLQRARQIHAATQGFTPPFAPADQTLTGDDFLAFLDNIEAANLAIANKLADWKDTVSTRSNLLAYIKARVLRASARVKSNPSWAKHVPTIKAIADKIRGYRTTPPKPPTEEGAQTKATREKGDHASPYFPNATTFPNRERIFSYTEHFPK